MSPPPGTVEERVDALELQRMSTIEFAPPAGVSPAHGGIILSETVLQQHKVAWLIQAAIDGAIELDDTNGTRITRLPGTPATPDQEAVLGAMFASGATIELGSYDRSFANGWGALGSRLSAWRASSGLWNPRGDSRRITALILGVLAAPRAGWRCWSAACWPASASADRRGWCSASAVAC